MGMEIYATELLLLHRKSEQKLGKIQWCITIPRHYRIVLISFYQIKIRRDLQNLGRKRDIIPFLSGGAVSTALSLLLYPLEQKLEFEYCFYFSCWNYYS